LAHSRPEDYRSDNPVHYRRCNIHFGGKEETAEYTDGPLSGMPFTLKRDDQSNTVYWERGDKRSQSFNTANGAALSFKLDQLVMRPIEERGPQTDTGVELLPGKIQSKPGGVNDPTAYSVSDLIYKFESVDGNRKDKLAEIATAQDTIGCFLAEMDTLIEAIRLRVGCLNGDEKIFSVHGSVYKIDATSKPVKFYPYEIPEVGDYK
jgi:hypothetical protein